MSEDPPTFVERSEDELSRVGLVAAETVRAAEVSVIALAALLFCPPLLILVVIVVVPTVAVAGVVALVVSVIALPVFVVRHVRRHHAEHAQHHAP
jgi:positive regulator of sigma E activity